MNSEMDEVEELPDEVDFSKGHRGHFAGRLVRDVVTVQLEADVAQVFKSADEVNAVLRMVMKAAVNVAEIDQRVQRKAS